MTTIEGIYGAKWQVTKPEYGEQRAEVAIDSRGDAGNRIFMVADVLNAMRDEGVLDAVEIITELPEVEESPSAVSAYVDGFAYGVAGDWADGRKHREQALRSLALARYCEARNAAKVDERKAAGAVLAERRDALGNQFRGFGEGYAKCTIPTKAAIDYIIEMEDSLAAK